MKAKRCPNPLCKETNLIYLAKSLKYKHDYHVFCLRCGYNEFGMHGGFVGPKQAIEQWNKEKRK